MEEELARRIKYALAIADQRTGRAVSVQEKQWVIDQIVRALTGDDASYQQFVREYNERIPTYVTWQTGKHPE